MNGLYDEASFSAETLAEWESIVDAVNDLFAQIGTEDEDFAVSTECGTRFTIDLTINNYDRIRPEDVLGLVPAVRAFLVTRKSYWKVRIHVYKPEAVPGRDDCCIWLEIDRYRVQSWRGKREVEMFDDIEALYQNFWPTGAR
jgi:hypothetical protein